MAGVADQGLLWTITQSGLSQQPAANFTSHSNNGLSRASIWVNIGFWIVSLYHRLLLSKFIYLFYLDARIYFPFVIHAIQNLEMWARKDPLTRPHQNNRHSCGVDWVFVWLLTLRGAEEIVVFEVFISLLQINCLGKFADRILWFGGHLKTKTCLRQLTRAWNEG